MPVWAFVTLGLAAPMVALIGVIITTYAESRRGHRNWLRQTKYESYERVLTTYLDMARIYGEFLDADEITPDGLSQLSSAATLFKHQHDKTSLVSSLRVSFYMQMEMFVTWLDIYWQLEAAEIGKAPPQARREWGKYDETKRAMMYELGVRRDPRGWLGKWRDRGNVVPSIYVDEMVRESEREPVMTFEISNPYGEANDEPTEGVTGK